MVQSTSSKIADYVVHKLDKGEWITYESIQKDLGMTISNGCFSSFARRGIRDGLIEQIGKKYFKIGSARNLWTMGNATKGSLPNKKLTRNTKLKIEKIVLAPAVPTLKPRQTISGVIVAIEGHLLELRKLL